LIHFTAVAVDFGFEDLEDAIHQLDPFLGAELFEQRRRAFDVGDDDGDLFVLAL
jgi:hypothetical protein